MTVEVTCARCGRPLGEHLVPDEGVPEGAALFLTETVTGVEIVVLCPIDDPQ